METGKSRILLFGAFRLNVAEHQLLHDGKVVPLTPKNFDVLRLLVENAGHLVLKEDLLRTIWPDSFVEEANLNRSVSVLRRVLGAVSGGGAYIETVPKRGYRFAAEVNEEITGEPDAAPATAPTPTVRPRSRRFLSGALLGVSLITLIGLAFRAAVSETSVKVVHRKLTFSGKAGVPAITPDGKLIAYISREADEEKVLVQERLRDTPRTVFAAPELGNLRWSPDGSELLFWARGNGKDGLYVVSNAGGSARKLIPRLATAAWSPDGSMLAVVTQLDGRIHFLDRVGKHQRSIRLQGVERWIYDLDWSNEGVLLFVNDDHKGKRTISTIRPDGSLQQRIIGGFTGISAARWAPGGDAIYYMQLQDETASLYKLLLKSGAGQRPEPEPLVTGLETEGSVGVSADGRYLVYARTPFYSNLWRVRVQNEGDQPKIEPRQLTQGTSLIERPSLSPDGKLVVYSQGSPSASNLYIVPVDGGTPRQLTFSESLNLGGVWSPDGRAIAFVSNEGGPLAVWVVPFDGGPPQKVSVGNVSDNSSLSWSPGKKLLYQLARNQNYSFVDVPGLEHPLLEDNRKGWVFNPVYSPDGEKIAVAWSPRRKAGLFVLEPGKAETLVTPGVMPLLIAWAADGKSVYALDGKSAESRGSFTPTGETATEAKILQYPLNGSLPKTLAELPFEEIGGISISPDGRTVVCVVYTSSSDVWITENFDPARE